MISPDVTRLSNIRDSSIGLLLSLLFVTALASCQNPVIPNGGTVSTPTFTPTAGTYSSTESVTIADATAGSAIYYTTDGTTPTTSSNKYSSAISVSSTTTIEALAVKSGMTDSPVATAKYTINSTAAPKATLSTSDALTTNQQTATLTLTFDQNVAGLSTSDFTVTSSASTASVSGLSGTSGKTFTVTLNMPTASSTVTVSVAANAVTSQTSGLGNTASNSLSFQFYYFPFTVLSDMTYESDSKAVWAIDKASSHLLRYDIAAQVVKNDWTLNDSLPVSMAEIGNTLYIIGQSASSAIEEFQINETTPASSSLSSTTITPPSMAGSYSLSSNLRIFADPTNNWLIVIQKYSDGNYYASLLSTSGSVKVSPTKVFSPAGNTGTAAAAYGSSSGAGILFIGQTGISPSQIAAYDVGSSTITQRIAPVNVGYNLEQIATNSSGTRVMAVCGGGNAGSGGISGASSGYVISDLTPGTSSFSESGYWTTGAYPNFAIFGASGASQRMYEVATTDSSSNEVLQDFDGSGTAYTLLGQLAFPYSNDTSTLLAASPDGTSVAGFSYNTSSNSDYRFYLFKNLP